MPERESKIDVGTLGPNPCQIALNKILIEIDDAHITNLITSRYHNLRQGLLRLEGIQPYGFCIQIMQLYYQKHIDLFESHKDKMPVNAYTHARCCYKMLLKQAIKRITP